MEEKYTPGPWHIENEPHNIWDKHGLLVARCYGSFEDEERTANARLVAVAPEMLEELRKSADTFKDSARALRLLSHDVFAKAMDIAEISVRMVIAKAEEKEATT